MPIKIKSESLESNLQLLKCFAVDFDTSEASIINSASVA